MGSAVSDADAWGGVLVVVTGGGAGTVPDRANAQ